MKKLLAAVLTIAVGFVFLLNVGGFVSADNESESQPTVETQTTTIVPQTTTKSAPPTTTKKITPTTTKKTEQPTTKKKTKKKKKKKVVKKIIKKKVKFKKKWKYAKYTKIHSGKAILYKHSWGKNRKVVAVNAGHGTKGGERYKTRCHPDGSPKLVSGSTKKGAKYSTSISSGTSLKGKSEAAATLSEAKILKKQLLNAGFDVLMIRTGKDVQLDNIARTLIANHYADCHLAIHYDSSSKDKGAFFLSVPNIKSYRKMMPVKKYWKKHNKLGRSTIWGLRKIGVKIYGGGSMPMDLTQTSYSTVPSIDIEIGDKKSSTSKKTQTKIAKGIVKGIKKFF